MNTRRENVLKIIMATLFIAGLFMPYIEGIVPFEYLFDSNNDLSHMLSVTIPVLVIFPFLLILIFRKTLKPFVIKILKISLIGFYIIVLGNYVYSLFKVIFEFSLFFGVFEFSFAILFSLILFAVCLKYSADRLDFLEHLLLCIIALPIFLHFAFVLSMIIGNGFEGIVYGCYILNGSFVALYVMVLIHVYSVYEERKRGQKNRRLN